MQIVPVTRAGELAEVRILFKEYADSLAHHICLTHFQQELAGLPGAYSPPGGNLWLASVDGLISGCVALRPLEGGLGTGEVKRLYVRPEFRGRGLGNALMRTLITDARRIGYTKLFLDTLPEMKPAHAVYRRLGFERIPNPRPDPKEETWWFELQLKPERER